jgi:hypothetical protein
MDQQRRWDKVKVKSRYDQRLGFSARFARYAGPVSSNLHVSTVSGVKTVGM